MSKILANQIANYGDDSPIEIKEGLNVPAGKPIQAAGNAGTSGQVLSSTGTSIAWSTPFNGDYNTLTNRPTIPPAQINSDWNATSGLGVILNKPTVPPLSSVTTAAAGTAALSYNSTNGEFTFTPPDLSGYATEAWVGSQGYITSYTETDTLSSVVARGNNTGGDIVVSDNLYLGGSGATSSYRLYNTGNDIWIQNSQTGGKIKASAPSGFEVTGGLYGNTLINVQGGVTLYEDSGLSGSEIRLTTTGTGMTFYGDIELGSGDITTTGKLYYSNNFATTGDLPNATTYHGMFAHVHAEGHGYFAHAGAWTQLLDTGSSISELADVNLAVAPQSGQVLAYDGSNWVATAAGGGGGGIALTDLSVTTAAAGTAALTYNNVSGVFTFTPPDLSSYAQTANLNIANWDAAHGWGNHASAGYLVATAQDKTNWNTAYGWGDHASAGYLTAEVDTLQTVTARGATTNQSLRVNNSGGNQVFNINSSTGRLTVGSTSLSIAAGITMYHGNTLSTPTLTMNAQGGTISCGQLTAGGLTYPTTNGTSGQVLTSDGAGNVTWTTVSGGGGGGASVTVSDTAPGSATAGDLWWESDTGRLKIYYQDTNSTQWVDTNPPLADTNNPAAKGYINMNANSPTWTGTAGYTVAKSGGDGTAGGGDVYYTLTFPSAYASRTAYIVNASYDGTDWVSANGAQIGVDRNANNVVFCVRRWNEDPLNIGDIMVTIHNL